MRGPNLTRLLYGEIEDESSLWVSGCEWEGPAGARDRVASSVEKGRQMVAWDAKGEDDTQIQLISLLPSRGAGPRRIGRCRDGRIYGA